MKRLLTIFAALLLTFTVAYAQDYQVPEIKISHDRVSVNGKLYYAHVVTDKQTLYSISKVYNVSLTDIYEANKSLELETNGLKSGQVLLIPVEHRPLDSAGQEQHKQQEQQEAREVQEVQENHDNGIVQNEEVKIDDIQEENPQDYKDRTDLEVFFKWLFPGVFNKQDSSYFFTEIPEVIRVAIALPFSNAKYTNNSVDFYTGMLIAARDLGNNGDKLDIRTFDYSDSVAVHHFSEGEYEIVFGPITVNDLRGCMSKCPENNYVISPLDPHAASLARYNRMIQAPTPAKTQNKEVVEWLKEDYQEGDEIILLRSPEKTSEACRIMIDALKESGLKFSTISYDILQGRSIQTTFASKVSKTGTTRYLLASEDETFVNDAVRNISLVSYKRNKVALYANSKLRSFSTVETEHLHNAHSHICAAYFTDYANSDVTNFVMAYRALFGTEPNSFALHGYDTMHYFVNICKTYGTNWPMKLAEYKERGLQTDFDFSDENGDTGFVNKAVRRIEYLPDYSIVLR